MRNLWRILSVGMLAAMLLSGCAQTQTDVPASEEENTELMYVEKVEMDDVELQDEVVALAATPAVSSMLVPVASGTLVAQNNQAQIDYSNTADGYVMVRYTASTTKRLKVQVKGPTTTYTYNITPGDAWTTFPLSDGNGTYQVVVYENISGSKYATVLSQSILVSLKDEFAPFLRPNQYVDYEHAVKTVAKAKEAGLVHGEDSGNPLQYPGLFVIAPDGEIRYAFRADAPAGLPSLADAAREAGLR